MGFNPHAENPLLAFSAVRNATLPGRWGKEAIADEIQRSSGCSRDIAWSAASAACRAIYQEVEQLGRAACHRGELGEPAATSTSVYFMQAEKTGLIKIGVSSHPVKRAHDLTHHVGPIEILATQEYECRADAIKRERRLHKRFAGHRAHGEWFIPSEDIKELVNTL